jgi:hypothetical protein
MTWSVSASGTKSEVNGKVEEQLGRSHPDAAEGIKNLVMDQKGPKVSVSGSGSDMSCSLSISSFT